jgi:anti-sigma factor RsiW
MTCSLQAELTAYLDSELPLLQMKQVQQHLETCTDCRGTVELLKSTLAQLSAVPAFEPSPSLRRAVFAQLDRESESFWEKFVRWLKPQILLPSVGLVAAAVVVMVIAIRRPATLPRDAQLFELASNLELVQDYEVIGINSVEDLEVVKHLHELEEEQR